MNSVELLAYLRNYFPEVSYSILFSSSFISILNRSTFDKLVIGKDAVLYKGKWKIKDHSPIFMAQLYLNNQKS